MATKRLIIRKNLSAPYEEGRWKKNAYYVIYPTRNFRYNVSEASVTRAKQVASANHWVIDEWL